jgi:hypothetical protein
MQNAKVKSQKLKVKKILTYAIPACRDTAF